MKNDIFSQSPFRCRLDWGAIGAQRAAGRGDIIVIVDVLSFSTTVAYAVSQGAIIYPRREHEEALSLAEKVGAEIAVDRERVPAGGRYSLSPSTFSGVPRGTRVLLPSLNGGTCSQHADAAACIFAGALVNATAVSEAVSRLMADSPLNVTVIACGEREKEAPHDLRPAVEDYLGAGAVLSKLPFSKSPEAQVCESAFLASKERLSNLILESISGRELREIGFGDDAEFASRLDSLDAEPALKDGAFIEL